MLKITAQSDPVDLRIYADGILHLYLRKAKVRGIQAWQQNKKKCAALIEITLSGGDTILLEYNSVDKWRAILALIDEHI